MAKTVELGVCSGNTFEDTAGQNDPGERKRAWLLGHFMPDGDPRKVDEVCMAMNDHHKGIARDAWALNRVAKTLSILLEGRVVMEFPEEDVVLEKPGDYVMWGPGVPHRWRSEDGTKFMSIRWPSLAGDSQDVPSPRLKATIAPGTLVDGMAVISCGKSRYDEDNNGRKRWWIPVQYEDRTFGIVINGDDEGSPCAILEHSGDRRPYGLIKSSSQMPKVQCFRDDRTPGLYGYYVDIIVFDANGQDILISRKIDFSWDWEPGWYAGFIRFGNGSEEKMYL